VPDIETNAFELHARRFLGRLQKLTENFRTGSTEVESILEELDRIWPQIRAAFAWSTATQDVSTTAAELCLGFASCGDPAGGDSPLALRQSPAESRRWIEAALIASRRLGSPFHEAGFLYQRASVAFIEQQFMEARHSAERALELFRNLGEQRLAAISLNLLGLIALAGADADAAVSHLAESLGTFRALALHEDVAVTLGLLADAHVKAARFDEALVCAGESLTLSRERGNRRTELHALMTMVTAFARLGKSEEVNAVFGEVALLTGNAKTHAVSLTAFGHFDLVRLAAMEPTEGFDQLERDLVAFRELGNWSGEGFALVGLGLGYLRNGNRKAGRNCLEQAREVFAKHQYVLGVALSRKYLGEHFGES
jgi:tetratricopeptide (TPR) repeat protein